MSDKHSTPDVRKADDFKLTDGEKMDLRDGLQAWAGLLRSRSAQERLRARLTETAEHPDHEEARDSHARGQREEESADRLDQLAAKINASIGLKIEEQA
jgi:hypothetical protein